MIFIRTVNDYGNECNSCTRYIVLFAIFLIISINLSSVCIYFHWHLKRSNTNNIININANTETIIY